MSNVRSRIRRLTAVVSLTSALLLAVAPVSHAQDASGEPGPAASPSAFCSVLSADEVTQTVGIEVTVSAPDSSDTNCTYQADFASGSFFLLDVRVDEGTIADFKEFFPDVTDVTVGGREAVISSDATLLFIGLDNGILTLQMVGSVGEGVDQAAAIQALGELALPRVADIPLPTPEPQPSDFSFNGDPELEALFPTQVGGEDLEVQSVGGQQLLAMNDDPETLAPLIDMLDGMGKTIDDVSIGFGFSSNGSITAIRIAGVDAASALDGILPLILTDLTDPTQETVDVAGRQVIKITDGSDEGSPAQYVHASGEVIWMVAAEEPYLSEVLGALP
jgi:hypothetical protein